MLSFSNPEHADLMNVTTKTRGGGCHRLHLMHVVTHSLPYYQIKFWVFYSCWETLTFECLAMCNMYHFLGNSIHFISATTVLHSLFWKPAWISFCLLPWGPHFLLESIQETTVTATKRLYPQWEVMVLTLCHNFKWSTLLNSKRTKKLWHLTPTSNNYWLLHNVALLNLF